MLNKNSNKQVEIARSLIPEIKSRARDIEALRRLPDEIAQKLVESGLIQMGVAECYGGLESNPLDIVKTIELVSQADASAGWCLMNYQTAALISGSISKRWAKEIFASDEPCVPSGVLAPTGSGFRVEGGITVNGRWTFGSGCPNANWFFGMTVLEPDEPASSTAPREVVMALFSQEQFRTVDNWHVAGLCGTGSGDVIVEDAFVPQDRWWAPSEPLVINTPLFQIPLSTIFPPCVAAVALGVAAAALSEFEQMLEIRLKGSAQNPLKNHPTVQSDFAKAEALIGAAKCYLYNTTDAMWNTVSIGEVLSQNERRAARLAAAHAATSCVQAVDLLFHSAGSASILLEQPIQRYWRDANAITKHIQVSRKNFETMGKLRLTGQLDGQL